MAHSGSAAQIQLAAEQVTRLLGEFCQVTAARQGSTRRFFSVQSGSVQRHSMSRSPSGVDSRAIRACWHARLQVSVMPAQQYGL